MLALFGTLVCIFFCNTLGYGESQLVQNYIKNRKWARCQVDLCYLKPVKETSTHEAEKRVTLVTTESHLHLSSATSSRINAEYGITEELLLPSGSVVNDTGIDAVLPNNVTNSVIQSTAKPNVGPGCCAPCFCDIGCHRQGNCCPDEIENSNIKYSYPLGGVFKCIMTQVQKQLKTKFNNKMYNVVAKCHVNFTDNSVIEKCDFVSMSIDSYLPVVNIHTNETFRNVYCAKCNFLNEDSVIPWQAEVKCEKSTLSGVTVQNAVSVVLATRDCNILFESPNGYPEPTECVYLIDTCNVTGKWISYDKDTEEACSAYQEIYSKTYRNIFCYMCNSNDTTPVCVKRRIQPPDKLIPSFSLLLDFRFTDSVVKRLSAKSCPDNFVYDSFMAICRRVFCHYDFVFTTGSCKPRNSTACFVAYMKIMLNSSAMVEANIQDNVTSSIASFLSVPDHAIWDVYYKQSYYTPIDGNNTIFVDYFLLHILFLYNKITMDTVLSLNGITLTVQQGNNDVLFRVAVDDTDYGNKTIRKNIFLHPANYTAENVCIEMKPIQVTSLFNKCPYIEINIMELNFGPTVDGLYFPDQSLLLKNNQFSFKDTGTGTDTIHVCVDDYMELMNAATGEYELGPSMLSSVVMGYVTFACTIISVGCLIVTLVTYSMFSTLRTQPGVNNMCLTLFYLFGQLLFLVGVQQKNIKSLCIAIGAFLHFLWLMTILWMGVCSFHMFRVFNGLHIQNITTRSLKQTGWYCLVTITCSVMLMSINIVWSLATNERTIGYGFVHGICWISNKRFVAYTISYPALVVIVCNVTLLLNVVCKIKNMPPVNSAIATNRQYTLVYIKLSTLTGITWLSIVPYLLTDVKVFDYIFGILHASFGAFIMLAFICNRRVIELYRARFCSKQQQQQQQQQHSQRSGMEMRHVSNSPRARIL